MTERVCSCGAALRPDNRTDKCAECTWHRGAPPGETVAERVGRLNVAMLLKARAPDVVAFTAIGRSHYAVEFGYDADLVALLNDAVPRSARRWRKTAKRWEVTNDWIGPLAATLLNANIACSGLDDVDMTEWATWRAAPVPTGPRGRQAYLNGQCVTCRKQRPHRAGGAECERCHAQRVSRQRRVYAVLATKGLVSWPQAGPSTAVPICAHDVATAPAIDYAAAVDAVIKAAREAVDKPSCPVCDRRPAKGAVVHAGCRRRLLHLLADRPFMRARNAAFQADLCTVCLSRSTHRPGAITCDHCNRLVTEVRSAKQEGNTR